MTDRKHEFMRKIELQTKRLNAAEKDQKSALAHTVFLGTLGMLLILPTFAGAFMGLWLDQRSKDYSVSWTISLIILGLVVGAINVFWFIRGRQ